MPPQQVTTGPTPMEGVERTNMVVVKGSGQGLGTPRWDPYAREMDRRENRNCYNYGGFGHLAKNCRNRRTGNRIGEERRLEYGGNERQGRIEGGNRENLNGEQDLILLD